MSSEGATSDFIGRPTRSPQQLWRAARQDPIVQTLFFSLLLLGGDKLAIGAGGMSFRLVFPVLMALVGLLYLRLQGAVAFDRVATGLFFAFATAGALSIINSHDPLRSIGYTIWILFDFFIVVSVCYNFAKIYGATLTLAVWLWVFRIHAVLLLAELFFKIATHQYERPHLWFYETSYLAVFMTGYYGAALYLSLRVGKRYLLDIALAIIAMAALSSATAVFGVLFSTIANMVIAQQRLKLLLWSVIIAGFGIAILYGFFRDTIYFNLVAGFFSQKDSIELILARGGDRWLRVLIGWNAFLQNPWFGVGVGGAESYMHIAEYPGEVIRLITPLTDVRVGEPFCNIFVEVLGTTGLAGFIPFAGILGYAAWRMAGIGDATPPPEAAVFLVGFFCTLLAMQLDGTVLRYYVWSPLGLGLGALAHSASRFAAPTIRV